MSRVILPRQDAERALQALGYGLDQCPVCGEYLSLTLTVNGDGGVHASCSHGCAERGILNVLARERDRGAPPPASAPDPLAAVNAALAEGHIRVMPDEQPPRILRGRRYGTRGATFAFELEDGRTLDGLTAAEIRTRTRFGDAIAEQLGQTVELPPKNHRGLAALLVGIAEAVDDLDTPTAEVLDWLQRYVDRARSRVDLDDREQLADFVKAKESFTTTSGQLYVRPDDFAGYVQRSLGVHLTRADLARRLGRLGFTREQRAVRVGKGTVSGRYWVAPLSLIEEATDGVPTAPLSRQKTHVPSRGNSGNTGTPHIGTGEIDDPEREQAGNDGNNAGGDAL